MTAPLTQERVRELFDYREDGVLVWKVRPSNNTQAGDVAGVMGSKGYWLLKINRRMYYAHRIVFLWHHGYIPEHDTDHIDRNKCNNRIENLREVSKVCNSRNQARSVRNKSGVKGVCWASLESKWKAHIFTHIGRVHLGYFEDFLEAVCTRLAAEQAENWSDCESNSSAYAYVQNTCTGRSSSCRSL